MKITIKKTIFTLGCLTLFGSTSWAKNEGGGSHGGSYVVCSSAQPAELAEYYEIRTRPHLSRLIQLEDSSAPLEEQIHQATERLRQVDSAFADKIEERLSTLLEEVMEASPTFFWPTATDVNFFKLEAGCELKTAIHYFEIPEVSGDELIEADFEFLKRLPLSQQAAIWLHEAIYKEHREVARAKGEPIEGTLITRRMVQLLFSKLQHPDLLRGLISQYFIVGDPNRVAVNIPDQYLNQNYSLYVVSRIQGGTSTLMTGVQVNGKPQKTSSSSGFLGLGERTENYFPYALSQTEESASLKLNVDVSRVDSLLRRRKNMTGSDYRPRGNLELLIFKTEDANSPSRSQAAFTLLIPNTDQAQQFTLNIASGKLKRFILAK